MKSRVATAHGCHDAADWARAELQDGDILLTGFAALSSVALREPDGADLAIALAQRALRDAPENLIALFNLGAGFLLNNDKETAAGYFRRALVQLDPADRASLATFLDAACGKPDPESAHLTLARLRAEWPESPDALAESPPAWLQTPVGIDIPPTLLNALGFQVRIYNCPISP